MNFIAPKKKHVPPELGQWILWFFGHAKTRWKHVSQNMVFFQECTSWWALEMSTSSTNQPIPQMSHLLNEKKNPCNLNCPKLHPNRQPPLQKKKTPQTFHIPTAETNQNQTFLSSFNDISGLISFHETKGVKEARRIRVDHHDDHQIFTKDPYKPSICQYVTGWGG